MAGEYMNPIESGLKPRKEFEPTSIQVSLNGKVAVQYAYLWHIDVFDEQSGRLLLHAQTVLKKSEDELRQMIRNLEDIKSITEIRKEYNNDLQRLQKVENLQIPQQE